MNHTTTKRSNTLAALTIPLEVELTPKSKALLAFLQTLDADASAPPTATASTTPPTHGEYWPGQGGHYICTLPALMGMPARHLIAASRQHHHKGLAYGPRDDMPGAASHIDGAANTRALLASGKSHPAAKFASEFTADGHSDFFLPARLDMVMAHICAKHLFETSGWYFTSTQNSSYNAFVQDFEGGNSGWGLKGHEFRVCPVRVIQL